MALPPPEPDFPAGAELLVSSASVNAAVNRVAAEISAVMARGTGRPLALVVMRGGLIFAGQLLPLLRFPLAIDYVDASRYGAATRGGRLSWRVGIPDGVAGRTIVLIDDILDEGLTLAAVREQLLAAGAREVLIAVFADKQLASGKPKPVAADFVGVSVPDRYVFGFGMDVGGLWRNLPAVYALPQDHQG
jgi:hypoxanthine phosphoribosyltransferase